MNEIHEQIKNSIEYLSNLCLKNAGIHREYTDEDLSNAVIILQEVFMAKMFSFQKDKITKEQNEILAKHMKRENKKPPKKFFENPRLEIGRILIEELTIWKNAKKPTEEEFYRLVDRLANLTK